MCITKVESFDFAGKLYPTELEAVTAALNEIATSIVKQHSAHPLAGIMAHADALPGLLTRYRDLSAPDTAPAEERPSEKVQRGPGRTFPPMPALPRDQLVFGIPVGEFHKAFNNASAHKLTKAQKHIGASGYIDLDTYLMRASKTSVTRLAEILDVCPESAG